MDHELLFLFVTSRFSWEVRQGDRCRHRRFRNVSVFERIDGHDDASLRIQVSFDDGVAAVVVVVEAGSRLLVVDAVVGDVKADDVSGS